MTLEIPTWNEKFLMEIAYDPQNQQKFSLFFIQKFNMAIYAFYFQVR